MPGKFKEELEKLQDLKKSNPNGVSKEQYMDTLCSLVRESRVIRYYSEDDQATLLPSWKTYQSSAAMGKDILTKAKDDDGISILCKDGLDGDMYVIRLDKNGNLTDVSDGPVPVEEAMRRFNGPQAPRKPGLGDYLYHWLKGSFLANMLWGEDRTDVVEEYEQYEAEVEGFKAKNGYLPYYEMGKEADEKEKADIAREEQLNENDVEPDPSVKPPLNTEIDLETRILGMAAKYYCRLLAPSKLGYQMTVDEEYAVTAHMLELNQFSKPQKLTDSRLGDDWQAYAEFTTTLANACDGNVRITNLIDKMSEDGTFKELYGAYKTHYFNNRTIDLESALSEAVSKNSHKVDITSHILKGSTYNLQANQNQNTGPQNNLGF